LGCTSKYTGTNRGDHDSRSGTAREDTNEHDQTLEVRFEIWAWGLRKVRTDLGLGLRTGSEGLVMLIGGTDRDQGAAERSIGGAGHAMTTLFIHRVRKRYGLCRETLNSCMSLQKDKKCLHVCAERH
jgi:hypothetical protein